MDKTTCIVAGCDFPKINVTGLCAKHYGPRFAKNGHPAVKEARKAALPPPSEQDLKRKETQRRAQRRHRLGRYGMTEADFDLRWESQSGRCAICKRELSRTGRARCNIDHDHVTGKVRGLLCSFCNTGLGLFGDTAEGVAAALAYLRPAKAPRPAVRPSTAPAWTQDGLFAA